MKILALLLLSASCFGADEPAKTEKPKPIKEFPEEATSGEIPGWGFRHNPKRTGKYEVEGDALKITVASDADMNPGTNFNGPSSIVEVDGDFVAELTVAPLPTDHSGFVGGGLVLLGPHNRVARLNHAHNKPNKDGDFNEVLDWAATEKSGMFKSVNLSGIKFDASKPRMFRIERRVELIHGAFSNDGTKWTALYPLKIKGWPSKLHIGPFGLNMSSSPKTLSFTAFKVTPKAK
jgi:hypothetical protein